MTFYIIFGILMFGVLIFIHELGHFIAAKKCGVGIYEFAIGMGPKIFSKKGKDGVTYSVRLLPIGGFVSMHGEDDDENAAGTESSINEKPKWQRFIVISAGAVMNILLGFVIAFFLIIFGGKLSSTTVESFNFIDAPELQEFNGLKVGDTITAVDGKRIHIWHDLVYTLMNMPMENTNLTVIRDGEKVIIEDFIIPSVIDPKTGLEFGTAHFMMPTTLNKNPLNIAKQTFFQPISIIKVTWVTLFDTLRGKYGTEAITGPVGVVSEMKDVGETGGLPSLFYTMLIITINLGIMNLLPFPALDGGRLLFLIIEAITRRPLNRKIEAGINAAGLILLMLLMVFVTFSDISKIIK